jgi:ribosomal protein L37AE/L43A
MSKVKKIDGEGCPKCGWIYVVKINNKNIFECMLCEAHFKIKQFLWKEKYKLVRKK